ncbi:MAG: hypothetical protein ACFCVC_17345 [Acidimicrobiia bacterium]
MHTNHTTHHNQHRLRRTLAVTLAAGLMLPTTVALAKPGSQSDPVQTRPTAGTEAPARGPIARPAAQVATVYRGALDGALGSHTWSGDLFGTGIITTVTYDIVLDEAGVPLVTGVVVDESSLPAGATYELRSSTNRTSGGGDDSDDDTPKVDDPEPPSEEPAPVEVVAPVAEETTTTTMTEETTTTTAIETATVTFASRGGVKFSMDGRWAGLMLMTHGRLGAEPVIAVRTVMVSPPAERPDPVEETTTTTIAVPTEPESEKPERPDKPGRGGDERGDADRDTRNPGDRDRDQPGDRGTRGDDRGDRGRDKPPTGS